MTINVFVVGAKGKMGQAVVEAVNNDKECTLVGTSSVNSDDLAHLLKQSKAHVAVDFTVPVSVYKNAKTIIESNVHPIIGTSGLSLEQIAELEKLCAQKKLGGVIGPNFSIGAILMMHCAKLSSRYLPDVEIIELHHPQKLDAPSGTARKTAELIAEARGKPAPVATAENPSLGLKYCGIPIHAIRLPGVVASQEVLFGGHAETLSIRHDTLNRTAFMPGVLLACKKVAGLKKLVYGLEELLELA
jgi:4-hydroxy-tetrahydrodipicolinate reductase